MREISPKIAQMDDSKENLVTLKIYEDDRDWVSGEQLRIKKLGKPKPTQAELFAIMRELYAASIEAKTKRVRAS